MAQSTGLIRWLYLLKKGYFHHPKNGVHWYDTELHLMERIQSWKSGSVGYTITAIASKSTQSELQ